MVQFEKEQTVDPDAIIQAFAGGYPRRWRSLFCRLRSALERRCRMDTNSGAEGAARFVQAQSVSSSLSMRMPVLSQRRLSATATDGGTRLCHCCIERHLPR